VYRYWHTGVSLIAVLSLTGACRHGRQRSTGSTKALPRSPSPSAWVAPAAATVSELPDTAMLGTFRLRYQIVEAQQASCLPSIEDVGPVGQDQAWIIGDCGMRGRLTQQGFIEMTAPAMRMPVPQILGGGTCPGVAWYSSLLALSETEVHVSGLTHCRLDGNLMWPRPVEVFEGEKFRFMSGGWPFAARHDRSPDVIRAGKDSIFALALGKGPGPGPPDCAVYEFKRSGWSLLRACQMGPINRPGISDYFTSMGVDTEGRLWISAEGFAEDGGPSAPVLLKREQERWYEVPIGDSGLLLSGADGSLWLHGHALWHLQGDTWKSTSLGFPGDLTEIAVVRADDYWAIANDQVVHYDGHNWVRVAMEDDADHRGLGLIRATFTQVWVTSPRDIWQLAKPDQPRVAVARWTPPKLE